MIKTILTIGVLSFAIAFVHIPSASAWHLAGARACFRHAFVPDCGPSAVAVCKSRRPCALDAGKTIQVCSSWRCAPRNRGGH